MRRRLRESVALAALLAFVALSPAVTVLAAGSAEATARVCAAAKMLTDDRHPQDAERLIDERRDAQPTNPPAAGRLEERPACPDELAAAQAAIETAQALADDASDLQPPDADRGDGVVESWGTALERAEEALALDERNEDALAVVEKAHANMPAHRAARSWEAFVAAVRPLGPPLLALAVGVAGLGLLARSLTPIQLNWPILKWWERGFVCLAGVVSALAGGLLLIWGPVAATDPHGLLDGWSGSGLLDIWRGVLMGAALLALGIALASQKRGSVKIRRGFDRRLRRPVWFRTTCLLSVAAILAAGVTIPFSSVGSTLLPGVFGAALGVYCIATWLATRLRLSVEVKGSLKQDSTSQGAGRGSAHLIALLGELGAKHPRGIEVPAGSDVTALRGEALSEVPQQALVQAAVRLLQVLFGTTPWRVVVEQKGEECLAVVITRNGRSAGSAMVERSRLLGGVKPDGPIDLYRAAAAAIMTTLAGHHLGFEGLCGATEPVALARYYVATADLPSGSPRRSLLSSAVDTDPGNWLAQVALAHARWRDKNDLKSLQDYFAWLGHFVDEVSEDVEGFLPLRVRVLHMRQGWSVLGGRDVGLTVGCDRR